MFGKNSHCSYCGHLFDQENWPRKCTQCNNISYVNPLPVVVVLLSVWEGPNLGTLIQQRKINPNAGEWALTGGYIDMGETWREAACREVLEEIGLKIKEKDLVFLDLKSSTKKENLLIFCFHTPTIDMRDINFISNEEVSAIKIIYEPIELCFPSHTEVLKEYLAIR